ncbi:MAG: Brp/Blh family beta-carotene 15,15'-dioxygenase [Gammaproteobacteria bacterium]|nr:Brp/Blh family beta-carotene 15,15'-dioxygenase [Gammaproteobacteria bacterium]MBL6898558.1 Brp/Blh family beta-carotene 15,15'-dioxygenase [Gammaproteobacteria bacterium]
MIILPELFAINIQLTLLLITVSIIGIPHGYFDFLIAKKLFNNYKLWLIKFIFSYLSISLIYLMGWLYYSEIALIFFLITSIYHFGIEETEEIEKKNYLLIFLLGSTPIFVPILFHTSEVFSFFSILLNYNFQPLFVLNELKYIYVILFLLFLINYKKLLFLYILLLINFIFLPPLISFILYFCFHHSLRHYLYSMSDSNIYPNSLNLGKLALFFIILTITFTVIAIILMLKLTTFTFQHVIIQYIFITLACLTLPHLILNIYYENTSK